LPRKSEGKAVAKGQSRRRGVVVRTAGDLERVRRVAALAELLDIVLMHVIAERPDVLAMPSDGRPLLDVTVKTRHDTTDDHLHAWVTFTLSSQPTTIDVRATYRLVYRLSHKPAAADAKAFASVNAVFNAWPYWREVVQNFSARMGLPSPTVPLLKI
jgi:hypothetical protein